MRELADKKHCTGCGACYNICPVNAITMKADCLGFLYPKISRDVCIECGACGKVCPATRPECGINTIDNQRIFGARHKNIQEVETSRSGAIFIALSDWVLENDGVVYGAQLSEGFKVEHNRATTSEERDFFKGSKYIQSQINNCFREAKSDIQDGKWVLFSGTPCQIAGIRAYFGNRIPRELILVDIICHGVASPRVWGDYIKHIEREHGASISKADFRDKSFGWSCHKESFMLSDGYKVCSNLFATLFLKDIMSRRSCSSCPYANFQRVGDISLGDFWGWQESSPDANADDKGLSLILVNSAKGEMLWRSIGEKINSFDVEHEKCLQPNLISPSKEHRYRDIFEKAYSLFGFTIARIFYKLFEYKKARKK